MYRLALILAVVWVSVLAQAQQEVAKEGLATDSTVYDAGLGFSTGDTTLLSNDSLSLPRKRPWMIELNILLLILW